MANNIVTVSLRVRDLEPEDLPGLGWSGGTAHQRVLAESWQQAQTGAVAVLVVETSAGALVACGGVRLTQYADAGELWMLAVRESWRSLGVGSLLIDALENAAADAGHQQAQLSVELDNPAAERLYRRLGYRSVGLATDSWPLDGGGRHVAPVRVLRRALRP